MNLELIFRTAFWGEIGFVVLMRAWFANRVRRAGERLAPDRASIGREGGLVFAIRFSGLLLLLVLIVLALRHKLSGAEIPMPIWLRWSGLALGFAGAGLWTWTHVALGRFWSPQLQLRTGHELIMNGPYSHVRHPMYTAIVMWLTGLGLVIANWVPLIFAFWMAAFVYLRASREEKMMLEHFGDGYREYMSHTGRFLPL
jgi:protein-S-isoprenylcysteine O-methyltransferase Ste14